MPNDAALFAFPHCIQGDRPKCRLTANAFHVHLRFEELSTQLGGLWRLIPFRSHRAMLSIQYAFSCSLISLRHLVSNGGGISSSSCPIGLVKFVLFSHRTTHSSFQLATPPFPDHAALSSSLLSLHHSHCKPPSRPKRLYCLLCSSLCRTTQSAAQSIHAGCQAHWRRIHSDQVATSSQRDPTHFALSHHVKT